MNKTKLGIYLHGIHSKNTYLHENPLPQFDVNIFCEHTFSDEKRQISQYKKISKINSRGKVVGFSNKSKKRLSWIYNNYDWKSMLTLTYHVDFPLTGQESKNHLHAVLIKIKRMGIKFLWVLEWQGRGYPHYHIWLSKELIKEEKEYIVSTWLNVTSYYNYTEASKEYHYSESIYTKWNINVSINYAVKYAYKSEQKGLPLNVATYGRWYGHSRMKIEPIIEYEYNDLDKENYQNYIQFNRNVHRCINHWRKKNKKNKKYGAQRGYLYILSDIRRESLIKLFQYHFKASIQDKIPEWVEKI